jgi:hypothetical protein
MMRSNMGKQVTQGPMKKKKMKAGGKVAGKPVKMQKGGAVPCASCPNPAACRKAGRCLMAG